MRIDTESFLAFRYPDQGTAISGCNSLRSVWTAHCMNLPGTSSWHTQFTRLITYNWTTNIVRVLHMATKLELEEYLYRRAIEIIESAEPDSDKEKLLFQEVWCPLADLYKDKITAPHSEST